jgi:hypothetical protein
MTNQVMLTWEVFDTNLLVVLSTKGFLMQDHELVAGRYERGQGS